MTRSTLVGLTLMAISVYSYASECNDAVHATAPASRFAVAADGTVIDSVTGLQWQRCAVGFSFDDNGTPTVSSDDRCLPTESPSRLSWAQALGAADSLNSDGGSAGFTDWRVPGIKELASIVEWQCLRPAVNSSTFPATEPTRFWSSTPAATISSALGIDFDDGHALSIFTNASGFESAVRLVRGGG
ncbi:MAG: DUF1566 domain-containing protein [Pseudomonadota bacterium]